MQIPRLLIFARTLAQRLDRDRQDNTHYREVQRAIAPRYGKRYSADEDAALLASTDIRATAQALGRDIVTAIHRRTILRKRQRAAGGLGGAAVTPDSPAIAPKGENAS